MTVNPIAFSGRKSQRDGGGAFRTIHLALDVNEGQTLCGQRIAYVEQAAVVRISIPAHIPFSDLCVSCEQRRIEGRYTR